MGESRPSFVLSRSFLFQSRGALVAISRLLWLLKQMNAVPLIDSVHSSTKAHDLPSHECPSY